MKTKVQNSELRQAIDQFKTAREALKTEEVKLESLQVRLSELSSRVAGLDDTAAEIGKRKKAMLSEVAIGNASESSLSTIRLEYEAGIKEREDAVEMVSAVENEITRLTAEAPPGRLRECRDNLQRLERSAWAAVAADVASKAPPGLKEYIERVFVAARQVRGGGAVELPYGLGSLAPLEIPGEKMEEIRRGIEKEYF